ncbi:hypothetical protein IL992_37335 [Microbispora sp. NEAU-D428]|uniref:hypothetical protein n=1 Tax=Microbispora sitophila TaxID=2771537 RepID=UPI001865DB94|nr:hypothetical protein [Microbispora sitophila]MBE3014801.1 hypothetical protein [Microbispora sitophila]
MSSISCWLRRTMSALTVAAAAIPVIASGSPANAATGITVDLRQIVCAEMNDTAGSDTPYFVVFIGSPTNPDDTRVEVVYPGIETTPRKTPYTPKTKIATNVPSGSLTVTVMLEQDGPFGDLNPGHQIPNIMHNEYQKYFWQPIEKKAAALRTALRSAVKSEMKSELLGRDDILGDSYATVYQNTVTAPMKFAEDDGEYVVRYAGGA